MIGTTFDVNRPLVVDETIDGETIVIHLGTGTYYSLDGVTSVVWHLAVGGADGEQIVGALQERYPDDAAAIGADVEALLSDLSAEDLIRPLASPAAESATRASAAGALGIAGPEVYSSPVLHKYTDMQAFMLTDPLHDVDEDAGWPHVRSA